MIREKKWDQKSSPNKFQVRNQKIKAVIHEARGLRKDSLAYLGLPGPLAFLEQHLASSVMQPENMYLIEEDQEVYENLLLTSRYGGLSGCHIKNTNLKDFVDSLAENKEIPKFFAVDCDFCGPLNSERINTIISLAKNRKLANRGILFANFCKGHEMPDFVNSLLKLDPKLAASSGVRLVHSRMSDAEKKHNYDKFRERFFPNFLIRQFANYGYRLSVREDNGLCEYRDSIVYMQQWTFVFKRITHKPSLISYKANLARPRAKSYSKERKTPVG